VEKRQSCRWIVFRSLLSLELAIVRILFNNDYAVWLNSENNAGGMHLSHELQCMPCISAVADVNIFTGT